jgi:hypothetical protein
MTDVEENDLKDVKRDIAEILTLLRGDGSEQKPGLVVRVDRLEQREKHRTTALGVLWTGIVAIGVALANTLVHLFTDHK